MCASRSSPIRGRQVGDQAPLRARGARVRDGRSQPLDAPVGVDDRALLLGVGLAPGTRCSRARAGPRSGTWRARRPSRRAPARAATAPCRRPLKDRAALRSQGRDRRAFARPRLSAARGSGGQIAAAAPPPALPLPAPGRSRERRGRRRRRSGRARSGRGRRSAAHPPRAARGRCCERGFPTGPRRRCPASDSVSASSSSARAHIAPSAPAVRRSCHRITTSSPASRN